MHTFQAAVKVHLLTCCKFGFVKKWQAKNCLRSNMD